MLLYNNILCFEAGWLIANNVLTESYYDVMIQRKKLQVIRRGCRNTPALIGYDTMPESLKSKIQEVIKDNPYNQIKYSALEDLIEPSSEAFDFFENYRLSDGRFIPKLTRIAYYNNAIVLDAIHKLIVTKQAKRQSMRGSRIVKSWEMVNEAAQSLDRTKYPHDLPTNWQSLERKYKAYKNGGFIKLIHKNYLNEKSNAAKVDDKVKESVLIEFLGSPQNLDNAQIARFYNQMGEPLGWKKITANTVENYRVKYNLETIAGRRGSEVLKNTLLMQHKRSAPTRPLYFLTLDGWKVELLYQKKVNGVMQAWHRPTIVIVLDGCGKYPLGYAIGTHETPELIQAALKNAAQHSAELFGSMYYAHQRPIRI